MKIQVKQIFFYPYHIALFAIAIVNLLVMHYTLFTLCNVERQLDELVYLDNFLIVIIEVLAFNFVLMLLTKGRLRLTAFITAIIAVIWAFCNVVYSRFFLQYISLSAIAESVNLLDPLVLKCLVDGFRIGDIFYLLSVLLSFFCYKKANDVRTLRKPALGAVIAMLMFIGIDLVSHITYCLFSPSKRYVGYMMHRIYTEQLSSQCYYAQPVYSNFQRGSLRALACQLSDSFSGSRKLTDEQRDILQKERVALRKYQSYHNKPAEVKNVVFILVESLMSFAIDMKIGGKEVTPFLNSLSKDSTVYYNGNMTANITLGESSDGQFIYMTGLLPLRSAITVTEAKKHSFLALPKLLSKYRDMQTRMIIPTAPSMWSQDIMCERYGIKKLISTSDYKRPHGVYLTDEEIFTISDSIDGVSNSPFFSMVLTFSMHQPYVTRIDESFDKEEPSFSSSLNNYLNACHYTDRLLHSYFDNIKERGFFNNSLIVIASDHHVGESALILPKSITERNIPLFIINGGIDKRNSWEGVCNQIDVLPTILDVLGLNTEWRGLGHSLLSRDYKNSLTENKWMYSEWMIRGGYFE